MQTVRSLATCPICGSSSNEFLFEGYEGIKLMKCGHCEVAYHNDFTDETEIREYYDHYYDDENLAFSPINERRFWTLVRGFERYRKTGNILDVGCGSGHLLKVALTNGWSAYGTEISSSAIDQLSKLGIKSFRGTLESASYPPDLFDVIYCSEVIEHLVHPLSLLRETARVLRPGGLLYLTTPNFNSISRKLLGSSWRVIGKEHVCYFTPSGICRAARSAGFKKALTRTRNLDPHEIKKLFRRSAVVQGAGFQPERTEALRHQLDSRSMLRFAKFAVNMVLAATGTGDTIVVRAEK